MSNKRTSSTLEKKNFKKVKSESVQSGCVSPCSSSAAVVEIKNSECDSNQKNESEITGFQQDVNQNDIALYLNKSISKQEKLSRLRDIWVPETDFEFPFTASKNKNLKFQHKWLNRWKWLAYSKLKNGAFCKYCVLFPVSGAGVGLQPLGKLCVREFKQWKHAIEVFNHHQETRYHKRCVDDSESLSGIISRKADSVLIQLNSAEKVEIERNRKLIIPIIETILLCGRQGLPLRGHNDSGPLTLDEPVENDGNFRALMRFGLRLASNIQIENEFNAARAQCGKNAQYLSPIIQNEIVEICNKLIVRKIVDSVNKAKCFSVLADETADISGIEQFCLSVRYVDSEEIKINEKFLQFVPVNDTTGRNLSDIILQTLLQFGINVKYLRGQGYDGASAMAGKFQGVQALIKDKYKSALFVHCSAHSLNSVITGACKVQSIRNTMGTLESVYVFMNTPKRQSLLLNEITNIIPDAKKEKLKKLCPTRWVERHDAVNAFLELQPAVMSALEAMNNWEDKQTSSKAAQILLAITETEFNISLLVINKIFEYTLPLCKALQKESLDLVEAVELAQDVHDEIKLIRKNSFNEFQKLYKELEEKSKILDLDLKLPRIAKRQIHRFNVQTTSIEEYYRISIFIPFLDTFLQEIETRFLLHKSVLKGFQCLFRTEKLSFEITEDLTNLISFYNEDLDDNKIVIAEFKLWHRHVSKSVKWNAIESLRNCNPDIYPNVFKLIKILCTLPVTTTTPERSFSTLRRIKTYLRNTTSEDRLNGLAALNIHRNVPISVDEIINEFSLKTRKSRFQI